MNIIKISQGKCKLQSGSQLGGISFPAREYKTIEKFIIYL